jgi:ATP-dependent RNA helicase RhlE
LSFRSLGLHADLLKAVDALGFTEPTPIQTQAIPSALEGRDLLGCAATGSGKTAAFLLPILQDLLARPRGSTRALVLAPTRELALQICADLEELARFTNVRATAVFGGVNIKPQTKALRSGVDVVVATPGRLLDHFSQGNAPFRDLEYLVLDEADRMLDMGFLPDIRRVLRHIPRPKQTLFFSATMPAEIEKLTREILTDPVKVALQVTAAPAAGVRQSLFPVPQKLKAELLKTLLVKEGVYQALVFTRTKHRADRLAKQLNRAKVSAERIHGNRSQAQRTRALAGFKGGDFQVLVATDIAARGIDVEELGHVVNIRTIERAVKGRLPRITLEGFDYTATGNAVEVPREERIAKIRAQRREDRQRAAAKAERGARAESDRKKGGGSERTRGGRGRSRRRGGGGSSSRAA